MGIPVRIAAPLLLYQAPPTVAPQADPFSWVHMFACLCVSVCYRGGTDSRAALVDRAPSPFFFIYSFSFSCFCAGAACVFVHRLDELLRQMYMDRTCPVVAWWLAPHGYSPTIFVDTLTGKKARSPPARYLFASMSRTLGKVAESPPHRKPDVRRPDIVGMRRSMVI